MSTESSFAPMALAHGGAGPGLQMLDEPRGHAARGVERRGHRPDRPAHGPGTAGRIPKARSPRPGRTRSGSCRDPGTARAFRPRVQSGHCTTAHERRADRAERVAERPSAGAGTQPADCGPSATAPFDVGEWIDIFAVPLTFPMVVLIAAQPYIMHRQTQPMSARAEMSNKMPVRDDERRKSSRTD